MRTCRFALRTSGEHGVGGEDFTLNAITVSGEEGRETKHV